MLLKEFKQISNEFGLSCYHDIECEDYSITLDNLDVESDNHIATWKKGHVNIYELPEIEDSAITKTLIISCGMPRYIEEYNSKEDLRKYILDALIKYKKLKKKLRTKKIEEL